jgi:hypothetical protein
LASRSVADGGGALQDLQQSGVGTERLPRLPVRVGLLGYRPEGLGETLPGAADRGVVYLLQLAGERVCGGLDLVG